VLSLGSCRRHPPAHTKRNAHWSGAVMPAAPLTAADSTTQSTSAMRGFMFIA
jgi:hypothetical protein